LARREYASWWDATASYTVTDGLLVSPVWRLAPKLALRGRVEQAKRDYLGPVLAGVGAPRQDVTRTALLALEWTPWRPLALAASWQVDRRRSSVDGFDFRDATAGITARLSF
jgi:hypothetical protein